MLKNPSLKYLQSRINKVCSVISYFPLQILLLLFLVLLVSACSPFRSHFECGVDKGVKCKSVGEVNDLLDDREVVGMELNGTLTHFPREEDSKKRDQVQSTLTNRVATASPKRCREEIMETWITGHVLEGGDFETASTRYVLLEPSKWETVDRVQTPASHSQQLAKAEEV